MASAYVEVILGVAVGVMAGVGPALAAAVAGGVVPSLGDRRYAKGYVAISALPIAGAVAIGAGLVTPTLEQVPRIATGGVVVALLSVFGFDQGANVGSTLHPNTRKPIERGRSLSGDIIDAVDGAGQVVVRPAGTIETLAGYPDLPPALRETIADERWRLPADLPLPEIEDRIRRQLELAYPLDAVTVTVDPRGTVTVAAAPSVTGLARRVPEDHRAVSIATSVPAGITPGDRVLVETDTGTVDGIVLGSTTPDDRHEDEIGETATNVGEHVETTDATAPAERQGGHRHRSRLTVAVPTRHADALLAEQSAPVAVESRDTRPDYRALSLLDRAGQSVRMTTVDEGLLAGVEDAPDEVGVFAAASGPEAGDEDWTFGPSLADLAPGWRAILVGDGTRLDGLLDAENQNAGVIDA